MCTALCRTIVAILSVLLRVFETRGKTCLSVDSHVQKSTIANFPRERFVIGKILWNKSMKFPAIVDRHQICVIGKQGQIPIEHKEGEFAQIIREI